MQPHHKAPTLRVYAVLLLVIGLVSVFYNAETGVIGFSSKAITALMANGIAAILAIVISVYAAQHKGWAHGAGAILCFLMLIVSFKQGFMTARTLEQHPHLWFKALVLGATAFVSLAALMPLLIYIRREQPTDSSAD